MKNLSTLRNSRTLMLVAQTYAKLFGISLRIQGSTAYTNGKVITIPRIKDDADPRLVYGYIAHEAGHIKHTNFSVVRESKSKMLAELFNILEDARIEKLMGREYVGVRENLYNLSMQVNAMPSEVEYAQAPELAKIESLVLWTAFYFHCGYLKHKKALVTALKRVRGIMTHHSVTMLYRMTQELNKVKDSEGALKLAKALLTVIRNKDNYQQPVLEYSKQMIKNNNDNLPCEKDLRNFFNVHGAGKALTKSIQDLTGLMIAHDSLSNDLAERMQTFMNTKMSNSKATSSREDYGVLRDDISDAGDPNYIRHGFDYMLVNTISRMTRAYVEKMHDLAEQGKHLDIKRLVRVPFGEENIFKHNQLELEHDTHVHILVDVSSSMLTSDGGDNSRAEDANRCALAVAMALERIDNVSRAVTHFPGMSSEYSITCKPNERINARIASRFDQRPRGSTPFAQALWYAFQEMAFNNRQRNVVIVITDGMPDSVSNVKKAFDFAKKNNVEIYGISIRSKIAAKLFEKSYTIENTSELNSCMRSIVEDVFSTKKLAA